MLIIIIVHDYVYSLSSSSSSPWSLSLQTPLSYVSLTGNRVVINYQIQFHRNQDMQVNTRADRLWFNFARHRTDYTFRSSLRSFIFSAMIRNSVGMIHLDVRVGAFPLFRYTVITVVTALEAVLSVSIDPLKSHRHHHRPSFYYNEKSSSSSSIPWS